MSDKISCIITDDEPFARKGLQGYVEKIGFLDLKGICEDALQLSDLLQQQSSVASAEDQYRQGLLAFWRARADFERALGEE